jgi:hypothetical protein
MLRHDERRRQRASEDDADEEAERLSSIGAGSEQGGARGHPRQSARNHAPRLVKDTNNREIPPAERAPMPKRIT